MSQKKRRILIATRVHLPEPTAASQRWAAVEKALVKAGFEVEVLTSKYPHADEKYHDNGIVVKRWPTLRDKDGNLRGYLPYLSFDIPLFFRILAAKRADLIMVEPPPTTGLAARAAAAIRRTPYMWYAADTWSSGAKSMGAPGLVVKLLEKAESIAISGAKGVIAVTEGVERQVKKMGAKRVFLVPNGIDTDVYRPGGNHDLGLEDPYFIYAGTASEFQGATIFLDAFERLLETRPQTQLLFVGGGSDWAEIRQRAQQINDQYSDMAPRVLVMDMLQPREVAPLLSSAIAALVSIAPLHATDTPYPTKILAALACETPVVFLGPGQAAQDISENKLGIADSYGVSEAHGAFEAYLDGNTSISRGDLREFVLKNRSMAKTGRIVVKAVTSLLIH